MLGIVSAKRMLPLEFKPARAVRDLLIQHQHELEHKAERRVGLSLVFRDNFAPDKIALPKMAHLADSGWGR